MVDSCPTVAVSKSSYNSRNPTKKRSANLQYHHVPRSAASGFTCTVTGTSSTNMHRTSAMIDTESDHFVLPRSMLQGYDGGNQRRRTSSSSLDRPDWTESDECRTERSQTPSILSKSVAPLIRGALRNHHSSPQPSSPPLAAESMILRFNNSSHAALHEAGKPRTLDCLGFSKRRV
jgi:hypothetical protein